jgi:imidazolonepropionase-like amidohydrolase
MSHRLGTLEKAKAADILVRSRNPYDGVESSPIREHQMISPRPPDRGGGRFAF